VVRAVLTAWLIELGFDSAWSSSLSSERRCIFSLHDALFIFFEKVVEFFISHFAELRLVGLALDLVN